MSKTALADEQLLDQFVSSFKTLDQMIADEISSPNACQLTDGVADEDGYKHWEPKRVNTASSHLDLIYEKLPGRFPKLFEKLVLRFRWAEVDLGFYKLLANPPGDGLDGFLHEISKDSALWDALVPAGYIQFAKGPDVDYDPVCFDLKNRSKKGECRIVKISHEEILCNNRVRIVSELATSFRELMLRTIRDGAAKSAKLGNRY